MGAEERVGETAHTKTRTREKEGGGGGGKDRAK